MWSFFDFTFVDLSGTEGRLRLDLVYTLYSMRIQYGFVTRRSYRPLLPHSHLTLRVIALARKGRSLLTFPSERICSRNTSVSKHITEKKKTVYQIAQ